jgi:hypothetical protein
MRWRASRQPADPVPQLTADAVRRLYREILGREPEAAEVERQLASAADLDALLTVIFDSDEHRSRRDGAPPPASANVVNVWHEDLAAWGYPPGRWSDDGIAVVGHAGWLFLGTGSNAVLDQYRGETVLGAGFDERWAEAMEVRRSDAARLGVELVAVVVPDKLPVLREQFPAPLPDHIQAPAARLADAGLGLLYPLEQLRAVADGACLRTDTHLTYAGNAALARLVAQPVGVTVTHELTEATTGRYVSSGDLGSRFTPPVVEIVTAANDFGAARLVEDNRAELDAVGGHIGTRQVLRNEGAADPRTAVVFGDSYGYAAAHYQGLAWFLAQAFREVHFVWVPFGWDPGYVEDVGAGVVVCQGAERFVVRPPALRIDARELAVQTLARRRPALLDDVAQAG